MRAELILEICYKHKFAFNQIFRKYIGERYIRYFDISIFQGKCRYFCASSNPCYFHNLYKAGLEENANLLIAKFSEQYEFFHWQDLYLNHQSIYHLKHIFEDNIEGFDQGFCLVRKINHVKIIYSFGIKLEDVSTYNYIINSVNYYMKTGDDTYNQLVPIIAPYIAPKSIPYIEQFYPFTGGKPVIRHTEAFQQKTQSTKAGKVIQVDFCTS